MKQVCAIRMEEGEVGILTDMGDYTVIMVTEVDPELPIAFLTHKEGHPVDPHLDQLSSMPYLIINDDTVIHGDRVFSFNMTIPEKYRWSALPIVKESSIVDYTPTDDDFLFINDGYVAELKDAKYVIVAPEADGISSIDLLIRSVAPDGYESFSGRTIQVNDIDKMEGRYIYTSSIPVATGPSDIDIPYTYTRDSLHGRYILLQERLQDYGKAKAISIASALESMGPLLESRENQYRASSIYDEVHQLVKRLKSM